VFDRFTAKFAEAAVIVVTVPLHLIQVELESGAGAAGAVASGPWSHGRQTLSPYERALGTQLPIGSTRAPLLVEGYTRDRLALVAALRSLRSECATGRNRPRPLPCALLTITKSPVWRFG
jgi:hypothetical protein